MIILLSKISKATHDNINVVITRRNIIRSFSYNLIYPTYKREHDTIKCGKQTTYYAAEPTQV